MAMQWYCIADGKQQGPMSEDELRRMAGSGALKGDDLVWNESMGDQWAEVSTVPELILPTGPPVLPSRAEPVRPPPPGQPGEISLTGPVGRAWARMVDLLFRPFDLGLWFTLGFSAWLSQLGQGGGSFNMPGGNSGGGGGDVNMGQAMEQGRVFLREHGAVIAAVIGGIVLVALVIGLVVTWLQCRGKFMFLDNVVNKRAEIGRPWREFKQHANSLFLWLIVYGIVCIAVTLILLLLGVFAVVVPMVRVGEFTGAAMPGIFIVSLLFLLLVLVTGYIGRFLEDFVIPLMYGRDLTAGEAWRIFVPLFREHFWGFFLYGLFYMVLAMGAGLAAIIFAIVTCCIGGCLMMIPYVGAVVMLPVTVFFRHYSLEYLAQFGDEFRFRAEYELERVEAEPVPTGS